MPIHPLTFLGDRDAPDALSTVHARRPILGSGQRPKEIIELAARRTLFLEAAEKPSVRVEQVTKGEGRIWRIDVPVDERLQGARPGLTLRREKPEAVLKKVDERLPVSGFRPDWTDALFVPRRTAPEGRQTLKRFNGRRVTPLWVFGQDDRWEFRDPSWPWGLVGRIFNNRGFSGTTARGGCSSSPPTTMGSHCTAPEFSRTFQMPTATTSTGTLQAMTGPFCASTSHLDRG